MAVIYDVTEFATALKPWLLEHLLDQGADAVLYLDPDIRIFGSLDPLAEAAADHGIALTPHCDVALPLDGKKSDDRTILGSGVYNLGFIGVGGTARPFLAYWQERLRRECVMCPERMRFVDQRWVDFVPGLFDHAIVRDPQYNVAYWNLHGRTVRLTDTGYEVNGRPLGFFHFSGYSPARPHLLSKHQGEQPADPAERAPRAGPALRRVRARAGGQRGGAATAAPYGFDRMADGTPVDEAIRTSTGRGSTGPRIADEPGRNPPPDPFDPDEVDGRHRPAERRPIGDEFGEGDALSAYLSPSCSSSRPDLQAGLPRRPTEPTGTGSWSGCATRWPRGTSRRPWPSTTLAVERPSRRARRPSPSCAGRWAPPDRLRAGIVVAGYPQRRARDRRGRPPHGPGRSRRAGSRSPP